MTLDEFMVKIGRGFTIRLYCSSAEDRRDNPELYSMDEKWTAHTIKTVVPDGGGIVKRHFVVCNDYPQGYGMTPQKAIEDMIASTQYLLDDEPV